MPKYGRGPAIEIVSAVMRHEISEPITVSAIQQLCDWRGWNVPESYINVILANSSSETHSPTFVKRFRLVAPGEYIIRPEFRRCTD